MRVISTIFDQLCAVNYSMHLIVPSIITGNLSSIAEVDGLSSIIHYNIQLKSLIIGPRIGLGWISGNPL